MNKILDSVNNPGDLKKLNLKQLEQLSEEIREFVLQQVSKTGGHLASNLGTIELTIALHYVFNSPGDKFLWDVGHQAYTHKILTGRKDQFDTLRQIDGLSGFLKREESEHDILEAGHSSTSISAALGLSIANQKDGMSNFVLPIIGDGALTAGLAYEALNYAGQCKSRLMVILNDNEMSISNNVGSISKYLSRIRTMKTYNDTKNFLINHLTKTEVGTRTYKMISKTKTGLKELIIPGMLFEHFGLHYIGPVNGHNLKELIHTFEMAKKIEMPIIIHVHTLKGKGYRRAELGPGRYHGVGTFDLTKGVKPSNSMTFSSVFGDHLMTIAKKDKKIMAITAAMSAGTGLSKFSKELSDQYIDVGIAEQNAVTMAAGLAIGGYKPYVVIYSTFLQRAFDQIIHDVALQNLSVTLCLDRSGLVGRDGETHQGTFDTSYLSMIPNLRIMVPKDTVELKRMLDYSVDYTGPLAIKYSREEAYELTGSLEGNLTEPEHLRIGEDAVVITAGRLVREALKLDKTVGVINLRTIKPLNHERLLEIVQKYRYFLIVEENVKNGSFTIEIENVLLRESNKSVESINLPDQFIEHGSIEELIQRYGLDAESMKMKIEEMKRVIP
jgi:1-deoxy-D-xylulose-5-phosphate synthase